MYSIVRNEYECEDNSHGGLYRCTEKRGLHSPHPSEEALDTIRHTREDIEEGHSRKIEDSFGNDIFRTFSAYEKPHYEILEEEYRCGYEEKVEEFKRQTFSEAFPYSLLVPCPHILSCKCRYRVSDALLWCEREIIDLRYGIVCRYNTHSESIHRALYQKLPYRLYRLL